MDKDFFRKKYASLRASFTSEQIEDLSLAIANRTLKIPVWEHTYFHVFLTISEKKEVNTEYLLHILQGRDKSIVLSKSDFTNLQMQHFLLQENTALTISRFGIPEPVDGIEVGVEKLEVIFVPLLAFDLQGNRIGYGKGFYDRFLKACGENVLKIGLSFFEAEEHLDAAQTDVRLDYCVTPKQIYHFPS